LTWVKSLGQGFRYRDGMNEQPFIDAGRQVVTVDVRDDIHRGREPFSKIMSAVAELSLDEDLLLLAPFEPVPLCAVLAKQGFAHQARQMENGEWGVLFTRTEEPASAGEASTVECHGTPAEINPARFFEVDARGLEPPQPLVKILETLATMPADAGLRARTDRRPMHLYAQLEARGFTGKTEEQNDGSFLTLIRRR